MVYLEATLAHKKEVKRVGPGELRAVKVIQNKAAQRERFTIPTNFRVPASSVIHHLFDAEPLTDGDGQEDLSQWESQGRCLESCAVFVEARKVPDRVIAIVQPVRKKRSRDQENTGS